MGTACGSFTVRNRMALCGGCLFHRRLVVVVQNKGKNKQPVWLKGASLKVRQVVFSMKKEPA